MKRWFDFFLCSLPALIALSLVSIAPAHAQSYLKTFVAMTGNDANDCHISRPCHTVLRAYNQTFYGGEVVCLDASSLDSSWNITKPITVAKVEAFTALRSMSQLANGSCCEAWF